MKKYSYQSHYNFSENAVVAHRELEGLEKVSINKDTKNLIIAVKGYQNGNPDPGKTQTKFYEKDSFVASLVSTFGNQNNTKVAVFDASMGSRTPNDISESIRDFRKVSPGGKLVLAGHSMGADNIVNVSTKNRGIRINKTITIDISDPLGKADNELSENVDSGDNYYQANIFSLLGGTTIKREEGNEKTSIKNTLVPDTSHTDIDNNETVKNQIIKDVKAVLNQ